MNMKMSHEHIIRLHNVILICSNLISAPHTNLNPLELGWNLLDSSLMSNKCTFALKGMYTVTYGCKMIVQEINVSYIEFCRCNGEKGCT